MEQHEKNKKRLKLAGTIVLPVGGVLALIGFISFFSSMGSGEAPSLFWCAFIGLPLLGVGGMLLTTGNHREISKYFKDENVPVMKELYGDLKPEINNLTNTIKNDYVICPSCNTENDENDSFCKKCGKPLYTICPFCNEKIDSDAVFCSKCGKEIQKD